MNQRAKDKITTTYVLSVNLKNVIDEIARLNFSSSSTIARQALVEYIKKHHPNLIKIEKKLGKLLLNR